MGTRPQYGNFSLEGRADDKVFRVLELDVCPFRYPCLSFCNQTDFVWSIWCLVRSRDAVAELSAFRRYTVHARLDVHEVSRTMQLLIVTPSADVHRWQMVQTAFWKQHK